MSRVAVVLASSFIIVVVSVATRNLDNDDDKLAANSKTISLNLTEHFTNKDNLINVLNFTKRGKVIRKRNIENVLLKSDEIKFDDGENSKKKEENMKNENFHGFTTSASISLTGVLSYNDDEVLSVDTSDVNVNEIEQVVVVTPVDSSPVSFTTAGSSRPYDVDIAQTSIFNHYTTGVPEDFPLTLENDQFKSYTVTNVYNTNLNTQTEDYFTKTVMPNSQTIEEDISESEDETGFSLFTSPMTVQVSVMSDETVSANNIVERTVSPFSTSITSLYEQQTFPFVKNTLSTSSLLQIPTFVSDPPTQRGTINNDLLEAVIYNIDAEREDLTPRFVPSVVSENTKTLQHSYMPNRTLYRVYNAETTTLLTTAACDVTNLTEILREFRRLWPVEQWKERGYFTEEYLEAISPHWLSFPPPSRASHYILAGLYTVIMVVGVAGNSLVIFMFLRCKSLKTPANILVLNLAVSDLLMLLKMPVFIYNSIEEGPALGEIGCQVYGFLGGLTGTVSIATLAAIGLDRYYVIVHPLDPIRRTTRIRARLCVLFVWLYGLVFSSIPLTSLKLNRYVPEGYLTSCSFDYLNPALGSRVFVYVFFTAAWIVPFFVLTFSYVMICRVVIHAREVKPGSDSSRHCREHDKRRTELRLAEVVLGVVGLWFVSWTPYAIVALLGVTGNRQYITPFGSMVPALFCKLASCIDPFVYAVTHPRFHQELVKMYHRMKRRKKKTDSRWPPNNINVRGYRRPTNSNSFDIDADQMMVVVDFEAKQYPEDSCLDEDTSEKNEQQQQNVYSIPLRMFSSVTRNNLAEDEPPVLFDDVAMEMSLDDIKTCDSIHHSGSSATSSRHKVTSNSNSTSTSYSSKSRKNSKRDTSGKKCSDDMDNPLYNELMQQWGKEAITSTPKGKKDKNKETGVDAGHKSKTKQTKYPRKLLGKSPKQNTFGKGEIGDLESGFMLSFNQLGIVKPPSWFNSPKPHANRATSLRLKSKPQDVKEKDLSNTSRSEPITV